MYGEVALQQTEALKVKRGRGTTGILGTSVSQIQSRKSHVTIFQAIFYRFEHGRQWHNLRFESGRVTLMKAAPKCHCSSVAAN